MEASKSSADNPIYCPIYLTVRVERSRDTRSSEAEKWRKGLDFARDERINRDRRRSRRSIRLPLHRARCRLGHPQEDRDHRHRDDGDHDAGHQRPTGAIEQHVRKPRRGAAEDRRGAGRTEREPAHAALAGELLGGGDGADRTHPAGHRRQQHRAG